MYIEHLLAGAPWRMRAWLTHPSIDTDRVAWRHDSTACLVAEWLSFELHGQPVVVDAEVIRIPLNDLDLPTPPLLSILIDLIDGGYASTSWSLRLVGDQLVEASVATEITAEEALASLSEAERRAARLQLPEQAATLWCCIDGCERRAWSPWLHGFLAPSEQGPFERSVCREFSGRICVEHWEFVVAPPPGWWSNAHRGKTYAGARS